MLYLPPGTSFPQRVYGAFVDDQEVHRVVEFLEKGQWLGFDPSSLQQAIPMNPWHNIIMARTTIADEDIAMTPRMGTSLGCPYGQELELLDDEITLWGKDFFWTLSKPIAECEVSPEIVELGTTQWKRFLESGRLGQGQIAAATASGASEARLLKPPPKILPRTRET